VDASCPLLLQTSMKLYRISGHVVFLLTLSLRAGRDQTPRRVRAPNTSQPVSGIGGVPKRFCNDHETSELFRLGSIILYCDCMAEPPACSVNAQAQTCVPRTARRANL